ncbi:catalytic LigB subunit of aromatic ring-opening dioxygenase [Strigomonas culicis]|uniref:Catalytic LigB subunit of aromatic ring-opening dioxygenase n=1 Tax=Strigomonas culicis TaxID=28005 RepID=S9WER9_9TRYP|nr:catalytic LigB subunit of aromatic ring-opening dioxygenase [Strigomonas culicis]|eukprot:EPY34215.1 catalytic LigB subunit of aromatic ring-opening dioxygenase [Strigomonas culicis]
MWYDYHGFPAAGYEVKYPAPGGPELAQRMVQALCAAGLPADANPRRPYDHGVFVPLLAMFPEADIPVVPISVLASDDPQAHMAMGAALRPFRAEGVFFFGSGATMHHFGNFRKKDAGKTFGDALTDALTRHPEWPQEQRRAALRQVGAMPGFREAQPDGAHEHLMPLLTLFGTSEGPAKEVANLPFYAANVRHYLFEG